MKTLLGGTELTHVRNLYTLEVWLVQMASVTGM